MGRQEVDVPAEQDANAIAIVGLACRFGAAPAAEDYWRLLLSGRSVIRTLDHAELLALGHSPDALTRPGFVPAGSVLPDADAFDEMLFAYSPQHAEWLDPQQRLLLELSWAALEDGGFAPTATGLRTGVFASVGQPLQAQVHILDLDAEGMLRFSSADKDFAATRVSYKLNLTGPSLTVQTACSSSLVAVHLATESLLGQELDLAVVTAASVHLPQAGYLASSGMILSPTGRCRPFDRDADGTVFGNGAGAIVLRRLSDAIADGDPVRAVLRGSAVNNDGASKMDYHAPSPQGQVEVVREAFAVSGVAVDTVGYVETHGTGTPVGDPIELGALVQVLNSGGNRPRCGVGSAKSVIGHLNTAAGLAGMIKAVLAIEAGVLPPQADYAYPNGRIDLARTALFVPTEPMEWPVEGPRRAAVSSFGIGGTNAHVVLEQAPALERSTPDVPGPVVVPISAATPEALAVVAGSLADHLDRSGDGLRLADVAYTLRSGRAQLSVRAVVLAANLAELRDALRAVADGATGAVTVSATARRADGGDEAIRRWAAGEGELPPGPPGRRVRLPAYPFARNRWPLPRPPAAPGTAAVAWRNVSDLTGFRLSARLEPGEPLLAEHRLGGTAVLPASVQLDALFAAATQATGRSVSTLQAVVFHRPLRAPAPTEIRVEVEPGQRIRLSTVEENRVEPHAEARVTDDDQAAVDLLDLASVATRCPQVVSSAEIYRFFGDQGIDYGPSFRVLSELAVGADEVLGTVHSDSAPGSALLPRLLDGVLQTVAGFALTDPAGAGLAIPFAIDRISVRAPFPGTVRVHLRRLSGARFDAVVTDGEGAVVARIDGLALRPAQAPPASASWPAALHLAGWRETGYQPEAAGPWPGPLVLVGELPADFPSGELARGPIRRHPMPTGTGQAERLGAEVAQQASADGDPYMVIAPGPVPDVAQAERRGIEVLCVLRGLARGLGRTGARVLVVAPADTVGGRVLAGGVAALGRSLAMENRGLKVIALETGQLTPRALRAGLGELPPARQVREDEAGRWWSRTLHRQIPCDAQPLIVHGGRYWLHGFGAVAALLAEHLLRAHRADLVLTARGELSGARGAVLGRLRALAEEVGVSLIYHRVDATDENAVREFARGLAGNGPAVQGVLHCAGVARDAFVTRSSAEWDRQVLAPKLTGVAVLDAATAGWPLDFFLIMSSVSGALGGLGQANYAFANAALDQFAVERDLLGRRGERSGRTFSVAWPYWAQGGMRIPGDPSEVLAEAGMTAMRTTDALAAFEALRAASAPAAVVLSGDLDRMRRVFPVLEFPQPAHAAPPTVLPAGKDSPEQARRRVVQALAEVLRTPVDRITPDTGFAELGVDSLMAIRVIDLLEPTFGPLPRTLLFEARTVAELAGQLAQRLPVTIAGEVGGPVRTALPEASAEEAAPVDPRAIAIIGMAGRFPDAENLDELWENLLAGRDSITEVPKQRWDADEWYREGRVAPGATSTKWGGFLPDVDKFDAPLFQISPREASIIDPQARLFLESCWAAFEDAGYRPDRIVEPDELRPRDVGVFVGVMYGEYQLHEAEERLRGNPVLADSSYWSIANRVSYFFDLQGPSMAVDTACSSALSAIQLACDSLRAGRCSVAIAGGVNLSIHPNKYFMLSEGRFAASNGRCRSFGAGGDGYVPGEGVGAVLLKPLAAALADGDHVRAVIRGSSANHGGRTNSYTVPNTTAQANLVTAALCDAGLTAADLDYVEAHGTGTALGDPIEIRGLTIAFGRDGVTGTDRRPIGSVKSNVGHLEAAAGVVALAKVLLQLRHRTLVPSLHADPPNPEIDFERSPVFVQRIVSPWRPRGAARPLRAAISSFGAGGAGAHLIVEEAPPRPRSSPDGAGPALLFLSARTPAALRRYASRLADHLITAQPALRDVAYVFAVGRVELACRVVLRARTLNELIEELRRASNAERLDELGPPPGAEAVAGWLSGAAADLVALCGAGPDARRIPLPHYPFERIRCWYDLQLRHLATYPGALTGPVTRHLRDFGLESPADSGTRVPGLVLLDADHPLPEQVPSPVMRLRPLATAPGFPEPAGGRIREEFFAELRGVLYLDTDELEVDRSFQELGVDSVLGVELIHQVNARCGLELKVTALYDYPTPRQLAEHLAGTASGARAEPPDGGVDAVLDAVAAGELTVEQACAALEPVVVTWNESV